MPARRRLSVRLFAAVWPPPAAVEVLDRQPRREWPDMRWTTPDQWHVTLRFFGSRLEPADLEAAMASAAAACVPVTAVLGPRVRVLGRRLLVVDVAGLDEVAGAVRAATDEVVGAPEDRPFVGHLTLARARGRADLRRRAGETAGARWDVGEITLVASDLRPSGAEYRCVGRYPLGG